MQAWAIAWHVYALTGSSFMVGLLGVVRVVPLLFLSLFGGVLADQADRRKVMLATQTGMAVVSLALFFLSSRGMASVAPLFVLVGLNTVARAFDGPARQALQVGLVPLEDYPNAASLNGVVWRMSDVLGPVVAGVMIAWPGALGLSGLSLCYFLNFLTFFALLAVVWRLPSRPPTGRQSGSFREVVGSIREGLRFVRKTPVVRHAMWIDFWATFFAGADALLPAFAGTVLGLDPRGYGILAASSGAGALVAALAMSWAPTAAKPGRWVVGMIAAFGVSTVGLGFAPNLWTACLCLAGVGAADMVSTVFRQTIRQLATPDELRGRMTATSSLFHISGPQLGDFEAGAVASVAGERASIVFGGFMCLVVAGWWSRARALTEHRIGERRTDG